MLTPERPLAISCTASDCDAELHCFRPTSWIDPDPRPRCRDCGADLIVWEDLHARDLDRIDLLFQELPRELVRHHYWHVELPEDLIRRTLRFRPEVIAERTQQAIRSRVRPGAGEIWRDGTQTPAGDSPHSQIYFLGMHAVAGCCRKCIQYWHGIPREEPLTEAQVDYLTQLVWMYVCRRLDWEEHEGLLVHD